MKEVVIMGKGSLAIKAADWFVNSKNYNINCIVPVMPEPVWTESLMGWARQKGIKVVESGKYEDIERVTNSDWKIDLAVSVFYDDIIKGWFINKCTKIINLHNGPLPRYRGVSPINWALKNEEDLHGVTIHEITEGIDDGPIVSQVLFSIYPDFDEVKDVYERALEYGYQLFEHTMPIIDTIKPREQNHATATYYSKKDDCMLNERSNWTIAES